MGVNVESMDYNSYDFQIPDHEKLAVDWRDSKQIYYAQPWLYAS